MENASKALIMAGSVLIALMIIGALMLMFGNLTSYQETDTQGTRSAQITEFNQQFETYNRNNVRGSDLYSLLNKVIDYNRRQSSAGTGATDRGQELQFTPMEITFTINRRKLVADGEAIFVGATPEEAAQILSGVTPERLASRQNNNQQQGQRYAASAAPAPTATPSYQATPTYTPTPNVEPAPQPVTPPVTGFEKPNPMATTGEAVARPRRFYQ